MVMLMSLWRHTRTWLRRGALAGLAGVFMVGCMERPIHARMTDDQAAGVLKECFASGMSRDEAEVAFNGLKIEPRRRRWYAATDERGPVLVGRVVEPGGYWPGSEDSIVEFLDVSLVFDKKAVARSTSETREERETIETSEISETSGTRETGETAGALREVRMRRGGVRYFRGDPVVQPAGADGQPRLMGRVGRFPLEPPPPRDPVVDTRVVVP